MVTFGNPIYNASYVFSLQRWSLRKLKSLHFPNILSEWIVSPHTQVSITVSKSRKKISPSHCFHINTHSQKAHSLPPGFPTDASLRAAWVGSDAHPSRCHTRETLSHHARLTWLDPCFDAIFVTSSGVLHVLLLLTCADISGMYGLNVMGKNMIHFTSTILANVRSGDT